MRNCEGYPDPTAGEAMREQPLRKVKGKDLRRKKPANSDRQNIPKSEKKEKKKTEYYAKPVYSTQYYKN